MDRPARTAGRASSTPTTSRPRSRSARETLATGEAFEVEYRFRAADGTYRWHLGRAVPIRGADGAIEFWVGTATDIHDRKRTEQAQRFLLEAGDAARHARSTIVDTLAAVARRRSPAVADWVAVHIVDEDGSCSRWRWRTWTHRRSSSPRSCSERYPPNEQSAVAEVIRTGGSQLVDEVTDEMLRQGAVDELHYELLRELGLELVRLRAAQRSATACSARSRSSTAESGRRYDETDLLFAEELARARSHRDRQRTPLPGADERAQASRVLETVADAVVLVDKRGDRAALEPGRRADHGVRARRRARPRRSRRRARLGAARAADPGQRRPGTGRAETMPVELGGRELWLSGSGVALDEGVVYAFRDLTEERALEQMRSDFVATVSHELRTPLAAIYGAALTIRRPDLELDDELHDQLLQVIAEESERLASIVKDVLIASHLDSGKLRLAIADCDPADWWPASSRPPRSTSPATSSWSPRSSRSCPPRARRPETSSGR